MFNVHPTNSTQIANSVQHDFRLAADNHRLAKTSPYKPQDNDTAFKVGIVLSVVIIALFAISQVVAI